GRHVRRLLRGEDACLLRRGDDLRQGCLQPLLPSHARWRRLSRAVRVRGRLRVGGAFAGRHRGYRGTRAPELLTGDMARRRLLIEGWRFLHHSYAIVAQSHCLCMLRRDDMELRFTDLPFYNDTWRRTRGVFAPAEEDALGALRAPEREFAPEATFPLRPESPEPSAPRFGRRFSFGTAEFRALEEKNRSGLVSGTQVPESVDIIAPSHWSALAYERFGLPRERVHVVPHGVDPALFRS